MSAQVALDGRVVGILGSGDRVRSSAASMAVQLEKVDVRRLRAQGQRVATYGQRAASTIAARSRGHT